MFCSARLRTLLLVSLTPLYGQASRVEFEVATVRPTDPAGHGIGRVGVQGGPGTGDRGRIRYINLDLEDLIVNAFVLHRYQVVATQKLPRARLDIPAKLPPGATNDTVRVMLQHLLEDRLAAEDPSGNTRATGLRSADGEGRDQDESREHASRFRHPRDADGR